MLDGLLDPATHKFLFNCSCLSSITQRPDHELNAAIPGWPSSISTSETGWQECWTAGISGKFNVVFSIHPVVQT